MTLPTGVFHAGPSPLMRMGAVHALVMSQQEDQSQSPEAKLAALVQAHPVFVLQFGLMLYIVLNFVLERYSPTFAHVMRVQALLCSFATNLLDCLLSMSVSGDVAFVVPPNNGTTPTSGSEASAPTLRKMELASLTVNAELLQRARADMVTLSQTRSGQQVAYALLALCCGAPRHSVLPVVIRGAAFLVRAAVLLVVGLVPLPEGVLEAIAGQGEAEGNAKRRGKKGKKGKKSRPTSASGVVASTSPLRMLFPFPLSTTAPSLHPETLDVLADMASFPVEFFVTRGWSKAAPKPKAGTPEAAAAAALPKPSTAQSIVQFLVMMVKGMVVMALLKVRLGTILDFLAPPVAGAVAVAADAGADAGASAGGEAASAATASSSSVLATDASAPFFMSRWPLFSDPITRNVVSLVRQMLSPEGVTSIPGMGPKAAEGGAEGVYAEGGEEAGVASAADVDAGAVAVVDAVDTVDVGAAGRKKGAAETEGAAGAAGAAAKGTKNKARGGAKRARSKKGRKIPAGDDVGVTVGATKAVDRGDETRLPDAAGPASAP